MQNIHFNLHPQQACSCWSMEKDNVKQESSLTSFNNYKTMWNKSQVLLHLKIKNNVKQKSSLASSNNYRAAWNKSQALLHLTIIGLSYLKKQDTIQICWWKEAANKCQEKCAIIHHVIKSFAEHFSHHGLSKRFSISCQIPCLMNFHAQCVLYVLFPPTHWLTPASSSGTTSSITMLSKPLWHGASFL